MERLAGNGLDPLPTDRGVKYSQRQAGDVATVLAAGIDWLTCSASDPARVDLLYAIGERIAAAEKERGNDLRLWNWMGYAGVACGGVATGRRNDGSILRLSSDCAAENWLHPVQIAQNVSRLDLAVTVYMPAPSNPAREAWTSAQAGASGGRGRSVQHITHIETAHEGETTYLGSRQSARFGRLYNKGLESGEERYRDSWRWEIEVKKPAALPMARAIADSGGESSAVLAYVWDAYAKWGCPPVWGHDATVPVEELQHAQTDDDRRLAWLATQVAGVVSGLIRRGKRTSVLSALGLTEGTDGL